MRKDLTILHTNEQDEYTRNAGAQKDEIKDREKNIWTRAIAFMFLN